MLIHDVLTSLFILIAYFSAGMDYHAINKFVEFPAGGATQRVRVRIIDDLGRPKLEGLERFQLVLLMPTGGRTGQPSKATITINDTYSDSKSLIHVHL